MIRHPVPLFRQRFDPDNWMLDGFSSLEDSRYWSERSCGLACVRMVIEYFHGVSPSQSELLREAMGMRIFTDKGWTHKGLAELLIAHGVPASTKGIPVGPASVAQCFTDLLSRSQLIIASITKELPCDGRRGGHLLVVTGYSTDECGAVSHIYFNDPSSWGQINSVVPIERFCCSFSGRIVIGYPKHEPRR